MRDATAISVTYARMYSASANAASYECPFFVNGREARVDEGLEVPRLILKAPPMPRPASKRQLRRRVACAGKHVLRTNGGSGDSRLRTHASHLVATRADLVGSKRAE
jgi:hypothetical protein